MNYVNNCSETDQTLFEIIFPMHSTDGIKIKIFLSFKQKQQFKGCMMTSKCDNFEVLLEKWPLRMHYVSDRLSSTASVKEKLYERPLSIFLSFHKSEKS